MLDDVFSGTHQLDFVCGITKRRKPPWPGLRITRLSLKSEFSVHAVMPREYEHAFWR